jgi:hypothetical protein
MDQSTLRLMPKVIQKIQLEKVQLAVVIAPEWTAQPWYQWLVANATRSLPIPKNGVIQLNDQQMPEPLRNVRWTLRAFLISRPSSRPVRTNC